MRCSASFSFVPSYRPRVSHTTNYTYTSRCTSRKRDVFVMDLDDNDVTLLFHAKMARTRRYGMT